MPQNRWKAVWAFVAIALGLIWLASLNSASPAATSNSTPSYQASVSATEQVQGTDTGIQTPGAVAPSDSVNSSPEGLSNDNYYTNSDGNTVHSPAYEEAPNVIPAGATARCRDGTYSFSQHRSGTCSHHGGVAEWL